MMAMWTFIKSDKNRAILSWIGGGVVVAASGLWAVVTFLWPDHSPTTVCAQQGSVSAGRDASGNTVTNTGGAAPGSSAGSVACVEGAKK
jgi:hypothetical protein